MQVEKFSKKLRYFSPLLGLLSLVWMVIQNGTSSEVLFLAPLYFVATTLGAIVISFVLDFIFGKNKWLTLTWHKRLVVVFECVAIFLLFGMPPYHSVMNDSTQMILYYLMASAAGLMLLGGLYCFVKVIVSLGKNEGKADEYPVYFFVYVALGYLLLKLLAYRLDLHLSALVN